MLEKWNSVTLVETIAVSKRARHKRNFVFVPQNEAIRAIRDESIFFAGFLRQFVRPTNPSNPSRRFFARFSAGLFSIHKT